MKKRILGVALGAAILFASSLVSMESAIAQNANDSFSAGPKLKCPSGDDYVCFTPFEGGVVYKGKGEATVED